LLENKFGGMGKAQDPAFSLGMIGEPVPGIETEAEAKEA
jgi:hypothetical protein